MSGPPDAHAWRATQASNTDPSPTIYLGSPIVDGPDPTWPDSIVVADEAQGREVVDQQQQRGADFIKVYSGLPRNAYFAIADEANKRGIPFEGHVPDAVSAAEASDAGQKSIEHLTLVAEGCSKEEKTTPQNGSGWKPRFARRTRQCLKKLPPAKISFDSIFM